ncbi:unnamed protein product [Malus baccata var. baccata]
MLRSLVLQFGDAWHKRLALIEFASNNSFNSSIGMSPFEAHYGKPCRTPFCWSEVDERVFMSPEIMDKTTLTIQLIKANLKTTHDRQKRIADRHSTDKVYKVGDCVFLKLSPWKDLTYDEVLVMILVWKDKVLRNKIVRMVKVLWRNHYVEEATWETEECPNDKLGKKVHFGAVLGWIV